MSASKTSQSTESGLAIVWRAGAVIILRALALAACAIVLASLLPEPGRTDFDDSTVPLWISIGLVVGLFTVVLAAWRPSPASVVVPAAEVIIATGLLVATWLTDDQSVVIYQAVPVLASVWLGFAAVEVARQTRDRSTTT